MYSTWSHFPSTRFPGNAVCRGRGVGGCVRLRVIFRQPDFQATQLAEGEWWGLGSDIESFSVNQIPGQGNLQRPSGRDVGLISSHFRSTRFPGKALCRGQGVGCWVRLGVIFQIAWGKMKTNKTHGIAGGGSGSQDMEPTGLMKSVPRSSKRHTRSASKQPGVQRRLQNHRDAACQPDSRAKQFAGTEEWGLASVVESFSVNQIAG